MKKKQKKEIDVVLADEKVGLTQEQVRERKENGYDNPIMKGGSRSIGGIILSELCTYFNLIYFVITIVLIAIGEFKQLSFLVIILANITIGIVQKIKSKLTVDKLSLLIAAKTNVIREGQKQEVLTTELVRDDIVEIVFGDQIGADSEVLSGEIKVNEALLTGESVPVLKVKGDKLLAGSYVVGGNCVARVVSVGKDNYVQQLTYQAKKYKKPNSVILNSLNTIIKTIGILLIPIAILFFIRTGDFSNEGIVSVCGSLLGMIPSGLFLLTSTTLAVSVIRLSKYKTLVQELYCIEMLARVDLVCMDKTGTITDGSMVVKEVVELNKCDRPMLDLLGNIMAYAKEENPTGVALTNYFVQNTEKKLKKYEPFSSETKCFSVEFEDGKEYLVGAPEYILPKGSDELLDRVNEYAKLGYRVLVLVENGKERIPLAFITLEDNVRQDAIDTIKYFKENGVGVKVISGDNPLTVAEVARRAGIENSDKCISLQDMSDEEVERIANEYTVFGRVSPKQKEILIKTFKKINTVAMIGDGVNDILALREADCSISVGDGSEAARNVSHLILLDNNFSSMVQVVGEGRRATNNIKNAASMFLTKTMFAVVLSVSCVILGISYLFLPTHMLILELFCIGIPSFVFALQPNTELIKGKFLHSVLKKSWDAALVVILSSLIMLAFVNGTTFTYDHVSTMAMIIATMNAVFVMIRVSLPLSKFKLAVDIVMSLLSVLAIVFLSSVVGLDIFAGTGLANYLSLIKLDLVHVIIVLVITALVPVFYFAFSKLNTLLFGLFDKLKEKIKNKKKDVAEKN